VRNFVAILDPDGHTVSVKDAFAVIKRRFDATDKMKSTLAKMDNEGKERHKMKIRTKRSVLRDQIHRRHGHRCFWRRNYQRRPLLPPPTHPP